MLRRWVMSPNNLNKFMIAALSLSLSTPTLFFSFLSWVVVVVVVVRDFVMTSVFLTFGYFNVDSW